MAPDRKKQTYFNHDWLKNKEDGFDVWLQTGSNKISFRCRVCNGTKDLALGQAGVGLLKKHANGDSHKKNLSIHMKTLNFFKPPTKPIIINDDTLRQSSSSSGQSSSSAALNTNTVRSSIFDQGKTTTVFLHAPTYRQYYRFNHKSDDNKIELDLTIDKYDKTILTQWTTIGLNLPNNRPTSLKIYNIFQF